MSTASFSVRDFRSYRITDPSGEMSFAYLDSIFDQERRIFQLILSLKTLTGKVTYASNWLDISVDHNKKMLVINPSRLVLLNPPAAS